MMDIVEIPTDGRDLKLVDSDIMKAGNVVTVQLGSLEYAPDFGSDLRYFLETNFEIQSESFKAYLIERLTQSQVNVTQVISVIDTLFEKHTFLIGGST
jgi:hypothetical protein